jgi:hypothetical protein
MRIGIQNLFDPESRIQAPGSRVSHHGEKTEENINISFEKDNLI